MTQEEWQQKCRQLQSEQEVMQRQLQQTAQAIQQENHEKFRILETQQQEQVTMPLRKTQELSEREYGRVVGGAILGDPQVQELASLQAECQELKRKLTIISARTAAASSGLQGALPGLRSGTVPSKVLPPTHPQEPQRYSMCLALPVVECGLGL